MAKKRVILKKKTNNRLKKMSGWDGGLLSKKIATIVNKLNKQ